MRDEARAGDPVATGDDPRATVPDVLERLRDVVTAVSLPLDLPGAARMRQERAGLLDLLDGYLVQRLGEQHRPLLVVIGGPTGAGKSTLLNSLVEAEVTTPGVLRPTTRAPVLVHHPDDAAVAGRLLPGLGVSTRSAIGEAGRRDGAVAAGGVETVSSDRMTPGLLMLDSPDLDSWLVSNREVAVRLLELADIWLFVTTGTDYADGVPWELLRSAVDRKVAVAAVLNRLRPEEAEQVPKHFARMLVAERLRDAPLLRVPEVRLADDRIPRRHVAALRTWLARQATTERVRDAHLQRAVDGTLEHLLEGVGRLVNAAGDQVVAARRLRVDLDLLFARARERLAVTLTAGALSGPIRAAWVGAAQDAQAADPRRPRRRLGRLATLSVEDPYEVVVTTAADLVVTTVLEELRSTLGALADRWASHPAAASVDAASLRELPDTVPALVAGSVDGWLASVRRSVADAEPGGTGATRGPGAAVVLVSVAVAGEGEAPAAAVAAARADLLDRVGTVLDSLQVRFARRLEAAAMPVTITKDLRGLAGELETLRADPRTAPALTSGPLRAGTPLPTAAATSPSWSPAAP